MNDDERLARRVDALRARIPRYPMTFLYVVMAVGAIDFADRAVLAVVFEDVKAEFGVSDTALGSLVAAYTVVATLSVIPCGILADRWRRTWLIAAGFVPWTLAMFWQGAATSFAMLFAARLFLGSIEATNGPAALSLVGDWYPVERRSRVMGVWRTFELLGTAAGFGIAGVIATAWGWRAPFFVFGALGVLCAAVVLRVLREPERGLQDALYRAKQRLVGGRPVADGPPGAGLLEEPLPIPEGPSVTDDVVEAATRREMDLRTISWRDAALRIARTPTAWIMATAASVGLFATTGLAAWLTTFFRRFHDMNAAEAGGTALLFGVGSVAGIIAGARIGDRLLARGDAAGRVKLASACYAVGFALGMPAFATGSTPLAISLLFVGGFLMSIPIAPLWAMWLDIIVPQLRGRADAFFSILRVIAISSSPLVIGAISDATDLRVAFLAVLPVILVNSFVILLALRSYPRDAARARSDALAQVEREEAEANADSVVGTVADQPNE